MKSPTGNYQVTSGGNALSYTGTKPSKVFGTIGTGLTAYSNNVEYSIGYDMNLSDKYMGHEGSVKLKVMF